MDKINKFFRDDKGKVVIAQWPNWPLWLAFFFWGVEYFGSGTIELIGFWGATISLIYWSYLEIVSGVNDWRKALGIIVLGSQVLKVFNTFA